MTNYEYDDLMLQFEQMRAQGWDPLLCDTPVPYYDGRVPCGVPTDTGDIVRGEYVMMPLEVAELEPIYTLTVRGDSMKDAGIASGDELRVLATPMADAVYLRPVHEWTPDLAPSVRISVLDRRTAIAKRLMQALSA